MIVITQYIPGGHFRIVTERGTITLPDFMSLVNWLSDHYRVDLGDDEAELAQAKLDRFVQQITHHVLGITTLLKEHVLDEKNKQATT